MESSSLASNRVEAARVAGKRPSRALLPWAGVVLYLAALGVATALRGVTTSRDILFVWILLGLLAASLTNLRRWLRGTLLEWLPFAAILFTYDFLRGYADSLFAPHYLPQLRVDELLFAGSVPSVWLQERLWDGPGSIDWFDYAMWVVYLTHFFATLVTAALLWLFASHLFRRYVSAVVLLAMTGFATYALFPAAPPWLASEQGQLAPTDRVVRWVSNEAPIDFFGALWEKGARYANDVAAVPSLHAAYSMLIALFFWGFVRWRWRLLLAAYPVAMALSLVYSAEHYVSDVLLGWLYAAGALAAVEWFARRRARRLA